MLVSLSMMSMFGTIWFMMPLLFIVAAAAIVTLATRLAQCDNTENSSEAEAPSHEWNNRGNKSKIW
jgi:hypothetical protein